MREDLDVNAFGRPDQVVYRIAEPATAPIHPLGMSDEDLCNPLRSSKINNRFDWVFTFENVDLSSGVPCDLQVPIESLLVGDTQFRLAYIHDV